MGQDASRDVPVIVPPVRTVQSETWPAYSFSCSINHVIHGPMNISFRLTGGRAFAHEGRIRKSPRQLEITKDEKGFFEGYQFLPSETSFSGYSELADAKFGSSFQALFNKADKQLTADAPGKVSIQIREHRPPHHGMRPFHTAHGFCDALMSDQLPLSADGIEELSSQ
ncbi:hypothetical protein [Erythrobacter sp.]|uniref:hypothetical protein n=1 Tax=Erythrobacter sp. TaxID=1042 RepID=UPI0032636ED3